MSGVDVSDCKYIPRGFTQPDCVRLCMNESTNGCSYNHVILPVNYVIIKTGADGY